MFLIAEASEKVFFTTFCDECVCSKDFMQKHANERIIRKKNVKLNKPKRIYRVFLNY